MQMEKKIAFIGVGNMAGAIIGSLTGGIAQHTDPALITLFDARESQYAQYEGRGFRIARSAGEAVDSAQIIVLAVKPQNYADVLDSIRESGCCTAGKVFISLAAGVTITSICKRLGTEAAVVRTMPNTPMLIGCGVTALCRNAAVTDADFALIRRIFDGSSVTVELPESQMNAVIAVTSSSPAYVYLFIQSMLENAVKQGFSAEDILPAICAMIIGSAKMVMQSGKTPDELIRMVTSPNGTTERAMKVLTEQNMPQIIGEAMEACTARADELSALME